MIIVRTPFRISFFGGGTDYPIWYQEHGGVVLATTINKYCYVSCRKLPPFFTHKHRVVYSRIEAVEDFDELQHPSAREVLKWVKVDHGVEIHHDADLPARSGLGSSSAFTVSLLQGLHALLGKQISKKQLAKEAIYVEQHLIKEHVGSQDQISSSFGGLNRIEFKQDKEDFFLVDPVILPPGRRRELESHLMLFFTGFQRIASKIAKSKIDNFSNREKELFQMASMVQEGLNILQNPLTSIESFGTLLHESWCLKRTLSDQVSNEKIDNIYEIARKNGGLGGKILGAGGGGFLLLFAKPELHEKICAQLPGLVYVPFKFEESGSRIIVNQSDDVE